MTQIIAGVLIVQDGFFIVQRRDNIPNIAEPGMLALWGGAAEDDESPTATAARELLEETGLVVQEQDLSYLKNYETHGRSPEFVGKKIDVYLYLLKLDASQEVHCYEGEEAFRFKSLVEVIEKGEKLTEFLVEAIRQYEATT